MSIEPSYDELRTYALEITRKTGRRVSEDELRSRVAIYEGLNDDLNRLIRQGLVARSRDNREPRRDHRGAYRPHHSGHRSSQRHEDRMEEKLERFARKAEDWIVKNLSGDEGRELTEAEEVQLHIAKVTEKAEKALVGERGHAVSFFGVNAMLFVIWFLTTPGGFPWFLIPLGGWGVGFVASRVEVRARQIEAKQVQEMKRPSKRHLDMHSKLWKSRRSFRGHLASSTMVAVLLGTINIITHGSFPWALIPAAGMAVGIFSHFGTFKSKERKLLSRLDETALDSGPLPTIQRAPDGTLSPAQIAEDLRQRISLQIESLPGDSPLFDTSFHENIDAYVSQVQRLATTGEELRVAIDSIPIDSLDTDRGRLVSRRDSASSERMRVEYEKSIEQIDRQKQSYAELKAEQEMIDLKITNAINGLRQLHLDVTRMKSMTPSEGEATLESLRRRSEELGRYLNDLRDGYDELG